jgi:Iodothyronine deiodinase
VYIAEAHSVDEWQMESNEKEGICIPQHKTFEERLAAARLCEQRLGMTIPTLVDAMGNAVSRQFAAWPERIYIVGTDGLIAFKGGPGPYEFDPEAAAHALQALIA